MLISPGLSLLKELHSSFKGAVPPVNWSYRTTSTNSTLCNAVPKLKVQDTGTGVEDSWLVELVNRGEVAGAEAAGW